MPSIKLPPDIPKLMLFNKKLGKSSDRMCLVRKVWIISISRFAKTWLCKNFCVNEIIKFFPVLRRRHTAQKKVNYLDRNTTQSELFGELFDNRANKKNKYTNNVVMMSSSALPEKKLCTDPWNVIFLRLEGEGHKKGRPTRKKKNSPLLGILTANHGTL